MSRADLREKLFNQVGKRKNKALANKRKKSGCLMFLMVFVIIFGFFLVVAVAKTGIIKIPILSRVFYQKPLPTRIIKIDDLENYQSEGNVLTADNKGVIIIEATERDLTASLRSQLTQAPDSYFGSDIQITIFPDELEFYSSLIKPSSLIITLGVKPQISNENLDFKITKTKIGSLKVDPKLVNFIVHWLTNRKASPDLEEKLKGFLNKLVDIQNFELTEGMVRLTVGVKLESFLKDISPTDEELKQLEEKYKDEIAQ